MLFSAQNMGLAFYQGRGVSHGTSGRIRRSMEPDPIKGSHGHQVMKDPFLLRRRTQGLVCKQTITPFNREQPKLVIIRQGGLPCQVVGLQKIQDLSQSIQHSSHQHE